jgi:Tfp pilus assembly PilM family ATPase
LRKRIISIDMGNHAYKVIEAVKAGQLRILRFGSYNKDEINSTGDLAKGLRRLKYLPKDVIISYHNKSMVIRELILPYKDEIQTHKYIQEEMEQYQSALNKELDYDYQIQTEASIVGQTMAVTAAVESSVNQEYIKSALRLGLRLKFVDVQLISCLRLINCLITRREELSSNSAYLLIDLGYDNTSIAIVSKYRVYASKTFDTGTRTFEENPEITLLPIILDCTSMITSFISSYAGMSINQGFVYGGGVYTPGILSYLKSHFASIKLEDMDSYREVFNEIPIGMDLNLYANCLGALLRGDNLL